VWRREGILAEVIMDYKEVPEKEVPEKCPQCGNKLLFKGPGWGFCDMCVCEITLNPDYKANENQSQPS